MVPAVYIHLRYLISKCIADRRILHLKSPVRDCTHSIYPSNRNTTDLLCARNGQNDNIYPGGFFTQNPTTRKVNRKYLDVENSGPNIVT